jgi:cellulose synthase/poly-beta-1,6-N-acetylglucosamine synthase-like glycosyltransferase
MQRTIEFERSKLKVSTRISRLSLVAAFFSFYVTVELLLFANRRIFGPNVFGNDLVFILISFLNIVPAGMFAFAVVSALPLVNDPEHSEASILLKPAALKKPRVAVLYATYNDFLYDYASYDYEQAAHLGVPFFILDDSNKERKKLEVDGFASGLRDCVVIRRSSRKGFKAGAVNNWMKIYGDRFDYFFLLDSDSRASANAIGYSINLARRDLNVALVQTKTLTMTSNPTSFTQSSVTVQHAYMSVVQNSMRNLGSSPYYGHNALIGVEALRSIGGFIEESNEDYKTLARLHNAGFKSVYASDAVTWEETPPDYYSARKRSLRWSRDAVGQLGLLRFKVPFPMVFYLFYGWATYMANLALICLFILLALGSLSLQVSTMGMFSVIAGLMTMSVVVLWPLLSLRVKDPELNVKSLLRAVALGTPFNVPMMAPTSVQIVKTGAAQVFGRVKLVLIGSRYRNVDEFVVTPKVRAGTSGLSAIVSSLKIEIVLGLIPITLAIASRNADFLLFSLPQIFSLVFLPMLIRSESRGTPLVQRQPHIPAYARDYARNQTVVNNLSDVSPQYANLRMH